MLRALGQCALDGTTWTSHLNGYTTLGDAHLQTIGSSRQQKALFNGYGTDSLRSNAWLIGNLSQFGGVLLVDHDAYRFVLACLRVLARARCWPSTWMIVKEDIGIGIRTRRCHSDDNQQRRRVRNARFNRLLSLHLATLMTASMGLEETRLGLLPS